MKKQKDSKSTTSKKQKESSDITKTNLRNEAENLMIGLPIVQIDFDGVIHSYTSGWKGVDIIPDPPVEMRGVRKGSPSKTSIDWLTELVRGNELQVAILSTRNFQEGGIEAMGNYLIKHGIPKDVLDKIVFPIQKLPAVLTIDDRAVQFKGHFFDALEISNFKPWKQK